MTTTMTAAAAEGVKWPPAQTWVLRLLLLTRTMRPSEAAVALSAALGPVSVGRLMGWLVG